MSEPTRSADVLVERILSNEHLRAALQKNPEAILRETAEQVTKSLPPPAYIADRWTYRIVVLALGSVCLVATCGAIYLGSGGPDQNIPDVLTALGAAAIGALAGLLAPTAASK